MNYKYLLLPSDKVHFWLFLPLLVVLIVSFGRRVYRLPRRSQACCLFVYLHREIDLYSP